MASIADPSASPPVVTDDAARTAGAPRARRDDGRGQDDRRAAPGRGARPAVRRQRRADRGRTRPHRPRDLRDRRRGGVPAPSRPTSSPRRSTGAEPTVIAAAGGVVLDAGQPGAAARTRAPWSGCEAPVEVLVGRVGRGRPPSRGRGRSRVARSQTHGGRPHRALRRGRRRDRSTARCRSAEVVGRGRRPRVERAGGRRDDRRPGRARRPLLRGARRRRRPPRAGPRRSRRRRERVAVVTQAGIGVEVDPGREHRVFTIGDGEDAKSLATVEDLCRGSPSGASTGPTPSSPSAAGWSPTSPASPRPSYHRGVPVVHVATTLLGQIDAAIGGKTGVNLPEGKNLVGAFWQPAAVLCDTEVLATLPPREYRSGLGELAKYHFLGGGDLDALPLDERVAALRRHQGRGRGRRRARGRAPGHAQLRPHPRPRPRDRRPLRPAPRRGRRHRARLRRRARPRASAASTTTRSPSTAGWSAAYDLPSTLPAGLDHDELVELMGRDKKALDGLTFVLDGPDGVESGHRCRSRRHRRRARRRTSEGDRR